MPTPMTYNVNVCWNSSTALTKPGPVDPNVTFSLAAAGTTTPRPHGEFVVNEGDSISFIPYAQCGSYSPLEASRGSHSEDGGDIVLWQPNAPSSVGGTRASIK